MEKILLSLGTLAIVGVVVAGATGAWFTNTETSTGNTFTAGVIDLKIDNESYITNNDGILVLSPDTSWGIKDLDEGDLFFDFNDLKPGDVGEDTISLHVGSNDAWACMDINITDTPENGQTEPEALVDNSIGDNEGELQGELEFVFWNDDGDNVLETDELEGIFWNKTLQEISNGEVLTLADSQGGVLENKSPLQGEEIYWIGKAWCQGELEITPISSDSNEGPIGRGTGISCDGEPIGDASQTDGVRVDVSFTVEQSRHNDSFLCNPPQEGTLTFEKNVNGDADPSSFDFYVDGDNAYTYEDGDVVTLSSGPHTVTEVSYPNYAVSYSGACDGNGNVTVPVNGNATCTITNTWTMGNLTITKVVVGGPLANSPNSFNLMVGTEPVDSGVAESFQAGDYAVTEDSVTGYTDSYGPNCPNGTITVPANGSASCTITNTYTLADLTVEKIVIGGPLDGQPSAFAPFDVSGESVELGVSESFTAGELLTVNENGDDRYTATYSGACDGINEVTLAVGEDAICTITNTYNRATLTVDKEVAYSDPGLDPVLISNFILTITGPGGSQDVLDEVATSDLLVGDYTVVETYIGNDGRTFSLEYGLNCDIGGNVTLAAGDNKTCRMTNREIRD